MLYRCDDDNDYNDDDGKANDDIDNRYDYSDAV